MPPHCIFMAAILKTAAILYLKMTEMASLGQTALKSIYYMPLYVNWQGNYTVCCIFFFLAAILFFLIWRSKRHISAWQQQFLDSAGPNHPKNTCCQKLTSNALTRLQSLLFSKWDQTICKIDTVRKCILLSIVTNLNIRTKSMIGEISDYNLVIRISAKDKPSNSICAWKQAMLRERKFGTTEIIHT